MNDMMITGKVPRLVKVTKTGEIVACLSFSDATLLYEIESATGKRSEIPGREITLEVGPEEEFQFDQLQMRQTDCV